MTALSYRERLAMTRDREPEEGGPFQRWDHIGRKIPHRRGMPDYLLMVARIEPARVRRVPAVAIAEEGVDDEGQFSLVTCPCGAHPVARSKLEKCAGCERYYVHVELGSVYLTYGAMTPPPLVIDA